MTGVCDAFKVYDLTSFQTELAAKLSPHSSADLHWISRDVNPDKNRLRGLLVREEATELEEALTSVKFDRAHILKEICDVIYVAVGAAVSLGLGQALAPAFNRVHANNMLKIETGTVSSHGKLVKPLDHPSVDLSDLVK